MREERIQRFVDDVRGSVDGRNEEFYFDTTEDVEVVEVEVEGPRGLGDLGKENVRVLSHIYPVPSRSRKWAPAPLATASRTSELRRDYYQGLASPNRMSASSGYSAGGSRDSRGSDKDSGGSRSHNSALSPLSNPSSNAESYSESYSYGDGDGGEGESSMSQGVSLSVVEQQVGVSSNTDTDDTAGADWHTAGAGEP